MKTSSTFLKMSLVCALTAFTTALNSQTLFFSWADQIGGTGYDLVNNTCTDNVGNVYATGVFRNTADFDPGSGTSNLTSAGVQDVFVTKVDAFGQLGWAVRVGGSGIDMGNEIAIDAYGYVYVAGSFEGTVDFDPGTGTANLTSQTAASSFILKLSPTGGYVWAKTLGSNLGTSAEGLSVSAAGVVHLGGNFSGTADLNTGAGTQMAITVGNVDMYIIELDSSGAFNWGINFGSSGYDGVAAVAEDVNGDIAVTGYFANTCDFDPSGATSSLTATGNDCYVAKYTSSGAYSWAKKLGGGGTDGGADIIMDFSGNVYTTGYFDGTADFDPGAGTVTFTASTGISDAFVSCLSASGNYTWAAQLGGPSVDVGQSITLDVTGNVYTVGRFSGTADFDPGATTNSLTSAGVEDVFISKLDASGAFVSAHKFGASGNDNGLCISLDASNNIFVGGYFNGTTDVDPQTTIWNLTSAGQDDGYIVKLSQSGVGIAEASEVNFFEVYPNPTAGLITVTMSQTDAQENSIIRLITTEGRLLLEQKAVGATAQLDLSSFAAGTYLIQVENQHGTATMKIAR